MRVYWIIFLSNYAWYVNLNRHSNASKHWWNIAHETQWKAQCTCSKKSLLLKSANNSVKLYESAVVNYWNPLLVEFIHLISHSARLSSLFFIESSMKWAIKEAWSITAGVLDPWQIMWRTTPRTHVVSRVHCARYKNVWGHVIIDLLWRGK